MPETRPSGAPSRTTLVTGAGGHLGRLVARRLEGRGNTVRLLDRSEGDLSDLPGEPVFGDVADPAACAAAVVGTEGVIHLAALHGVHLADHGTDDFWRTNVDGTYALLRAAAEAGAAWFVFASSIGVYGDAEGWLDENECGHAVDVYQLTKIVGEALVRFVGRDRGLRTVSLRLGIFVPADPDVARLRLLTGGIAAGDAATAVVRAAAALAAGRTLPAVLNVVAPVPFGPTDLDPTVADRAAIVERHWPNSVSRLTARGHRLPPITRVYPTAALERALGWQPVQTFGQSVEDGTAAS